MRFKWSLSLTAFLIVVLFYGCSGGKDTSSPVIPGETDSSIDLTGETVRDSSGTGNRFVLTYNLVYIDPTDPENIEIENVPLRDAGLHLNILKFLEQAPCTDCFKIMGFNIPEPGVLDVDIQITHPLPSPDFTIFDVRGIMMFDASHGFPDAGLITSDVSLGNGALLNADGYTALYNITTLGAAPDFLTYFKGKITTPDPPNGTLNGYIRHWSDDAANTRYALYAAASDTKTYSLKITTGPFVIGYAVDANWAMPIVDPVVNPMTDFGLDANSPEPWKMYVSGDPIGDSDETILTIDVYDWQGKQTYFFPLVECPELFGGTKTAMYAGDGDGYSIWKAIISNSNYAGPGEYMCLVSVEDTQNDPVGQPWLDLTAYQLFNIEVIAFIDELPTAEAFADKNTADIGESIEFDASTSHDNDEAGESIVKYEWDWDGDENFVEGPVVASHSWGISGTYFVQLRVTDDEGSTDLLDEEIEITILGSDLPPTAEAVPSTYTGETDVPIDFDATGSHDNDEAGESIVTFEWDWNGDMNFVEETMVTSHSWATPGIYQVQLRVTDDEGETDILDESLEITINVPDELPTAVAESSDISTAMDELIFFDATGSHDNDEAGESIVMYEWDWTGDLIFIEETAETSHSWDTPGLYEVQLRVTDDEGSTDLLDAPIEISVYEPDQLPTAEAFANINITGIGELIDFDASASHDNDEGDESIVMYEWDWDGDLNFVEETAVTSHSWDAGGTYQVQLRVTDDEGSWDLLDESIEITILSPEELGWVQTLTDQSDQWHNEVATDSNGDILVTGFDHETDNRAVLRKFSPLGVLIWDVTWPEGHDFICAGDGIAIDSSDNIYVTGVFTVTEDFDPGPGEDIHTCNGVSDIFLVKYNSGGDFQWARTWGGELSGMPDWWERGTGVAVDEFDEVYVVGIFRGLCDFDPGPLTDFQFSNGYNGGGFDAFLTKFTANGDYQWVQIWGSMNTGSLSGETVFGVATDSNSDIYVTGGFTGTVDFDPGVGVVEHTSSGTYGDVYLLKWTGSGEFAWVKTWEAIGFCELPYWTMLWHHWGGSYVTVDSLDNVLVIGGFEGTKDLDPGTGIQMFEGDAGYLSKFDSQGNFLWADTWQASAFDKMLCTAVITDDENNIFMSGIIAEEIDLDPGPDTDNRSAVGAWDGILVSLDQDGNYLWGHNWGSVNSGSIDYVFSRGIAVFGTSGVYVTGIFDGDIDFDPGSGTDIHSSTSTWASFVMKFRPDGLWW